MISDRAAPLPNIQPSGTITVCTGGDTLVCADAGFANYQWSDGSTVNCINASLGVYSVTVTDAFGCTGFQSVTVNNHAVPDPHIIPIRTILVCTGNDTLVCADAGFNNYLWTSGNTTACITVSSGTYFVTVTDGFGCQGIDSAIVVDYQPLPPVIFGDAAPFDTLFSSAPTGNQWYEAGVGIIAGATQNYFVPDHNGLYYVIETDANGCSSVNSDTTNFIYAAIQSGLAEGTIKVFPNPTHNDLIISLSGSFLYDGDLKIVLYDVLGRNVFESSSPALPEIHLSVSALAPAVYILEVTGRNGKFVTRIEKW
jgi:hypothetical protein